MSVIQDRATPVFALVTRNHVGFDAHARRDALVEGQRVEISAAQEVILGHLAEAAAHLAWRQCRQHGGIADDPVRLPERADEVLAFGQVDTGLAPDGRIDLRQQGRRDVNDRHAAVVARGGKPADVGNDTSADRDDDIATGETPLREAATQALDRRQRLGFFTFVDEEDAVFDTRIDLVRNAALRNDRRTRHTARQ